MVRKVKKSKAEAAFDLKFERFFACWEIYLDYKDTKTQINLLRYMRKHILSEANQ